MARTGMDRFLVTIVMAALLAAAGVLILAPPASAAPGDLDTTFDTDGKQTTDFDEGGDTANDVAIQTNGKIVVAGETEASEDSQANTGSDFAVSRYNTDGSLDTGFDTDGKVTTNFRQNGNQPDQGANDRANAVAIQPDGKIVAVGSTDDGNQDTAVARYDADGSLDDTFSGDGLLIIDLNPSGETDKSSVANDVAIRPSGKIVIVGTVNTGTSNTNFSLIQLKSNGDPDTTFGGGDGVVETDFSGGEDAGNGLSLTPGGGIVVAGTSRGSDNAEFALAKYTSDGDLDATFGGGDGKVTTSFDDAGDEAFSVAVADNGDLVVAGLAGNDICDECESLDFTDFGIARYTSAGVLVPSFGGGDGKVTTDFNDGQDEARDVKIQANGNIVAAGRAEIPVDCDPECPSGSDFGNFGLARYTSGGALDTSFGTGGKVQTSFFAPPAPGFEGGESDASDEANGLAIQDDGKIIAVGSTDKFVETVPSSDPNAPPEGDSEQDFALARYDGSGGGTEPNPGKCTKTGTPDNDVLRGTPRRDVICGRGGNDVIRGMGGNDIIRGGSGNDVIRGMGGNDRLFGQAGNDVLRGGPGKDVLRGGPGRDSVKQ